MLRPHVAVSACIFVSMTALPTVLILASGRGERFTASGGNTHKLHATLAGKPVMQHTFQAVQFSGLPWIVYQHPTPGMGHTIAAAVAATSHASGWLILPGDLPLVRPETLKSVAAALQQNTVVVPTWHGQRGHPVGFSRECGEQLMALVGDSGAAPVVRHFGATLLEVDDPGITLDIDTVQDLERAEDILNSTLPGSAHRQD